MSHLPLAEEWLQLCVLASPIPDPSGPAGIILLVADSCHSKTTRTPSRRQGPGPQSALRLEMIQTLPTMRRGKHELVLRRLGCEYTEFNSP